MFITVPGGWLGHSRQTRKNAITNPPIASTEPGENRAETRPLSSALTEIEPIATPIENTTRNRLATSLLA